MLSFLGQLFDTVDFLPRWESGRWTPQHGWVHIGADLATWAAFTAIPCVLAYFVVKRRDIVFPRIFWLFVAFIFATGTVHLTEAVIFWWPIYRFEGLIKILTATVSWATVIVLIQITPKALTLPGLASLAQELQEENEHRRRIERELRIAQDELEARIQARTAELARANRELELRNTELIREVSERKNAEAALRDSQALYFSLVDNLPVHVIRKDLDGRFTFVTRSFCELLGRSVDEILGQTDFDVYPRELAEKYRRDDRAIVASGRLFEDIEENQSDGERRYFHVLKTPVPDADGKIIGTQAIFWDVTHRKRAEEALREAKEAAESANRAKSDFLANMSHEIRTPMNAIIGMSELLLDTHLTETQREYLRMVRDSGESLLGIINDILDFSKIEAGKLELDRHPFTLREGLGDTMKFLGLRAHDKGLELACRIAADVPDDLIGDMGRLRQVLVNLVGNAIKFTERGEVVLDVTRESQTDEDVVLQFAVRDTGIGIPPGKQTRIFEAFEQADSSTTRRYAGTGLGLAISSRLVELMGGRIELESESGSGSTFTFTARFTIPEVREEWPSETAQRARIVGTRVLIVDDNATNRQILEEVLQNWGMQTTSAAGAREALQVLHENHDRGEPFPLVITDVQMPDIDGFTLVEEIRRHAELAGTVIMMLTSGDRPGDLARGQEFQTAAYLMKPVKQSELFDAVVQALGVTVPEDADEELSSPDIAQSLPPLQVLLAEDSVVNQRLAVGLLERYGHTVTVVDNGRAAVEAVETGRFDLVLMDVQMPELDGQEATKVIRRREEQTGNHIPIIAMTAHAMKGDREQCLAAGMDGYVAKPVRARELFQSMVALCRSVGFSTKTPTASASANGSVDWAVALESVQGDRALLADVIAAFREECPLLLEQLGKAVDDLDAESVRRTAHTLKGSIRLFGAAAAHDLLLDIETRGREERLDGLTGHVAELKTNLDALQQELAAFDPEGDGPA